ncbi:hypothetical protein OPT61_g1231 [Boeremia exigua]|uniref:Uncharacterized protein n=1 Tax=Boeremia exigua TaxID=749465 RepID=A0ACC2IQY3_9PLEO|nr:hypothetical protein OPT61_g1231 [Boeremia exigua]
MTSDDMSLMSVQSQYDINVPNLGDELCRSDCFFPKLFRASLLAICKPKALGPSTQPSAGAKAAIATSAVLTVLVPAAIVNRFYHGYRLITGTPDSGKGDNKESNGQLEIVTPHGPDNAEHNNAKKAPLIPVVLVTSSQQQYFSHSGSFDAVGMLEKRSGSARWIRRAPQAESCIGAYSEFRMKLLAALVVPLVGARVIQFEQQVPIVQTEVEDAAVPAVGVHFTTSYATAAARYENGTTVDLVRVEADADYIDLMSQWTRLWKEFDCEGPVKRLRCDLEQVRREARKRLRLPITRDSATLSTFVKKVRSAIETELGTSVSTIAPVAPQVIGWNSEDFEDALHLAGWSSSRSGNKSTYWDTNAAFAGLGYGMCASKTNLADCLEEERQMAYEHVLFLDFDNSSFAATVQYLQHADQEWSYSSRVETGLGWWNLPVFEVSRARFWSRIHEVILEVVGALQRAPNKIVLLGDHGADSEFLEVVKAALWDVLEIDVSLLLSANKAEDVSMLAARGAAGFAKRAEVWKDWKQTQDDDESMEL